MNVNIEQILNSNLTDKQKEALLGTLANEIIEKRPDSWKGKNEELKENSRKQADDVRERVAKREREYSLDYEINKMEDALVKLTNNRGEHIYTKDNLKDLSISELEELYYRYFKKHRLDNVYDKYYGDSNREDISNLESNAQEESKDLSDEVNEEEEISNPNEIVEVRDVPLEKRKLSEKWKALPKWKKIATTIGGVLGTAGLAGSMIYLIYNSMKTGDTNTLSDALNNTAELVKNALPSIDLDSNVIDNITPIYESSNDASLGINGMEPLSDARHTMVGTVFDTSGNQYDASTISDVIDLNNQGVELGGIPLGDAFEPGKVSGFVSAEDVINTYSGGKVR